MFDDATDLQNNLNRWYDATVGRWISEDPIGFAAGDGNFYRYVGNSPTNWIDPNGLLAQGSQSLDEFEENLGDKPGAEELMNALREIEDAIRKQGGPVNARFIPGKGLVCHEVDDIVEDGLRKVRKYGWKYKHREHDGWGRLVGDPDHNWGNLYGPDGEPYVIDFYIDFDRPITPGVEHPSGIEDNSGQGVTGGVVIGPIGPGTYPDTSYAPRSAGFPWEGPF